MIVSLHVATGAAGGALTRSRPGAIALGLALHALGDAIPHHDVDSQRFEIRSGVACLLALAATHGPLSPVTVGAVASSAPDIEHVLHLPRKLFPSHWIPGWHREGGLPTWVQLLAAGAIVGYLLGTARR